MNVRNKYYVNIPDIFTADYRETGWAPDGFFHIHDLYEITLVESDNMELEINNTYTKLEAHTLLLFNNMDLHRVRRYKDGDFKRYVIQFRPEYIESFGNQKCDLLECFFFRPFEQAQILRLNSNEYDEVVELLGRLCYLEHTSNLYGKDLMKKFVLGELLIIINNIYRTSHNLSSNVGNEAYRTVYKLLNYIHNNLDQKLTLDVLARLAYMNERRLSQLFKNITGTTPSQYIQNCRIMKAKSFLIENMSVEETCEKTGFGNTSNFSRTFRKAVGVSPKQYAMENRVK